MGCVVTPVTECVSHCATTSAIASMQKKKRKEKEPQWSICFCGDCILLCINPRYSQMFEVIIDFSYLLDKGIIIDLSVGVIIVTHFFVLFDHIIDILRKVYSHHIFDK
jgi:hypothetical protein